MASSSYRIPKGGLVSAWLLLLQHRPAVASSSSRALQWGPRRCTAITTVEPAAVLFTVSYDPLLDLCRALRTGGYGRNMTAEFALGSGTARIRIQCFAVHCGSVACGVAITDDYSFGTGLRCCI